jgi:hypothetical protein
MEFLSLSTGGTKMHEKMRFLMLLVICMAGIRCANSAADYEYRYNVEVTYTRPADFELNPNGEDDVILTLDIYEPTAPWGFTSIKVLMTKTGELTYKCFVAKIYVQKPGEEKHQAVVADAFIKDQTPHAEYISIQGAYDLETRTMQVGTALLFRMAKN